MDYKLAKLDLYSVVEGVVVDLIAVFEDKDKVETDQPVSFIKSFQTVAKLGFVGGLAVDGEKVLVVDIDEVEMGKCLGLFRSRCS